MSNAFSPDKLTKIRAFLQAVPTPLIERLITVADQADPALADILRHCVKNEDQEAKERFFLPLMPLGHEPGEAPPSLSIVPSQVRNSLWNWLSNDLGPDLIEGLKLRIEKQGEGLRDHEVDDIRKTASERILQAFKDVEDHPKDQKKLMRTLESHDFTAFRHAAVLLRTAGPVREGLREVPEMVKDPTDKLLVYIRDAYEAALAVEPDAGVWFLYFVMERFKRPWYILRVFQRLDRRGDDFLVSRTDTSGIGDALLKDAEYFVDQIKPPTNMEEAEASVEALKHFAAVTMGMTREFNIRKDGPWGQKLFALRADAARHMETIHQRTRMLFDEVLCDRKKTRGKVWRLAAIEGHLDFVRLEALLHFMHATKDDASRAAVEGAHKTLLELIHGRLEDYGVVVIDSIRRGYFDSEDEADEQLSATSQLLRVSGCLEEATLLVRRGVAARAA